MPEDRWLQLDSGAGAPTLNMALDETLLEFAASHDRPVLRFYSWTEPAATFGYFQHHARIATLTPLRPLIRRPTGGGLVPHDTDWTYSVVIPPRHEWYALSATGSYRRLHEWLSAAFGEAGIATELATCCNPAGPGQCFVGAERHDLLHQGHKVAGAAQRRNKLGLLIQGSVQPASTGLERARWQQGMQDTLSRESVRWETLELVASARNRADTLAKEKYSSREYNERR